MDTCVKSKMMLCMAFSLVNQQNGRTLNYYTVLYKVQWSVLGEKEVKTLIDLAMSASGQEPIELQKAACLRSALGGYAPLIFRLKPDDSFHDVVNHCNLVVQNLKTDPALPSKLASIIFS